MPFGLSWAPYCFDSLLNPLVVFLRALHPECRVYKYLDDILITSHDRDRCAAALSDLHRLLAELGFVVSAKKSDTEPRQRLEFLGVVFDFEAQECAWPLRHASAVADLAAGVASASHAHLVDLQRLLGKIAFLCQLCPVMSVWRRPLDDALASHLNASSPTSLGVPISPEARQAAAWWSANAVRLSARAFEWPTGDRYVVRSDASDWAGGVTVVYPNGARRAITFLLPPTLTAASSAAREFHVSIRGLEFLRACVGRRPLMRACIDLYTDSQASAGALARGARALPMRADGVRLLQFALDTSAQVRPIWLPRRHLAAEDAGSRRVAWSDASVHLPVWEALCDWAFGVGMRPTLDAFATAANARASRWISMLDEAGAAGTDGLRAPWGAGRVYAYPPAALAARARQRAVRETEALPVGALTVLLVGPSDVVGTGARRIRSLPSACVVLPPHYHDGPPVAPPVALSAAVFARV